MKKSLISALIITITIALVGLFSIQVYWIKNSIELRDAQFRRSVKVSLAEVNRLLAYEEKLERLRQHEYGQQIILQFDSLRTVLHPNEMDHPDAHTAGDKNLEKDPDSHSISKRETNHEKEIDEYFQEEQDAIQSVIQKAIQIESYQSEEIARLLLDISMTHRGANFLSSYGVNNIDSLLRLTLKEVGGITADFEFGIFDMYDIPQIIPNRSEPFASELVQEGYKARLLPEDYINPSTFVHLWFPNQDSYLLKSLWPMFISSGLFLITIVLTFAYTIRTIVKQKKVSDIKNDFINNITHELKTPISTISLACEALTDPAMSAAPQKVSKFVKMIKDENKRLGVLVESVLRSAVLDKSEMGMTHDSIDLHEIIEMAIRNIELQANSKGGRIEKSLEATNPNIIGDKIHLTNVVFNLLDNAVKYSGEKPKIKVRTRNTDSSIVMEIIDNGIGIKKEDQKRIFEKLFRVPTGNIHNIKGFGLGLSYVKAIIDKHHGAVTVDSEFGKGSTFTIQLPFNYEL